MVSQEIANLSKVTGTQIDEALEVLKLPDFFEISGVEVCSSLVGTEDVDNFDLKEIAQLGKKLFDPRSYVTAEMQGGIVTGAH